MENNETSGKVFQNPFETNPDFNAYLDELANLRADGETKLIQLREENREVKLNKQLEKEVKNKIIANNKELMVEATRIKKENSARVKEIVLEACAKAEEEGNVYYKEVTEDALARKLEAKAKTKARKEEIIAEHKIKVNEITDSYNEKIKNATDPAEKGKLRKAKFIDLKSENISFKSKKEENKSEYETAYQGVKDDIYNAFLAKDNYHVKVRNGHRGIKEFFENYIRTYSYNFKLSKWLLKNALNIIVVLFFLFSIFYALSLGKNLFTGPNILNILGQSSVKVFFSLGVAGLILLAGTDLSIGRMTGLGASFFNMILAKTTYESSFGFTIDVLNWPVGAKIFLAFLIPILLCVFFSGIAGFFSAKFKMHPFITTLSTQLLIYGLMMLSYGQHSAFNMDQTLKRTLAGQSYINIILFAILTIAVVWFIWNKTKFGKNMYAVGGNAEAASVSGISVFGTTFAVFIMAGVLYGLGGAATALQGSGANANTGYGTELDAIAACVVGGISFSGGIGKISGAVIGTIIFQGMTYCLTFLGFDVNIQYIFKGIIIMAAVCLDSVKYLKKK